MKAIFSEPKLTVSVFAVEDVVTTSYVPGQLEGWAPDSDDSEFG